MNLPEAYTNENTSTENKAVYKEFQRVINSIKESGKTTRGAILNNFGGKVWEEPEDEYLERMEKAGYFVIR